jgi:hypothetical protein
MNTPLERLLIAAFHIAREAPRTQGRYTGQVRVQWAHVQQIRQALSDLGVDYHFWDSGAERARLLRVLQEHLSLHRQTYQEVAHVVEPD